MEGRRMNMNALKADMVLANHKSYGSMSENMSASSASVYSKLAQLWACFGKYVCMINVGIVGSFPVLALPFVTSGSFKIKMSEEEMEWMVSILYITMAIGSFISAMPFNVNRKIPMIVAQAVMTISWVITFFANESWQLIMARALGGMSMTLSLPQVQAYIGEVTVPQLRGIFGNLTQTMTIMGQFVMSGLTYLNNWDQAVFISGCFPILAIIYLYFIPESPIVLVKNKKYDKAWSALKQLRGWKWANEAELIHEFRQIQRYCDSYMYDGETNSYNGNQSSVVTTDSATFEREKTKEVASIEETYKQLQSDLPKDVLLDSQYKFTCLFSGIDNPMFEMNESNADNTPQCRSNETIGSRDNLREREHQISKQLPYEEMKKISEDIESKDEKVISEESMFKFLFRPEMYKPTLLMIVCSFFIVGPGADSILIYLKWYIKDFNSQVDYNSLVSILTGATLLGNLLSVCCISKLGKRKIILLSTLSVGLGYTGLVILYYLKPEKQLLETWFFSLALFWIFFMEEFGIRTIYHSLMSEVFPLRGKKVGPMIIVLMLCINGFLVMHNMPAIISSCGAISVVIFDVFLNLIGALFFYVFLIETEGKTLGEIENEFSKNKKTQL